MRVTKKKAHEAINTLKIVREQIFEGRKPEYPYKKWERKRKKANEKLKKLYAFVDEAVSTIHIAKSPGRPKKLDLAQRTILFLFTVLINKSNRDTAALLEFFEPFFGFKVNYKYIERLYSDDQVKAALHNVFYLLLVAEGISGRFAGESPRKSR